MGAKEYGEVLGFLAMFLISTVILYFVLNFLKKMPENWGYFHIFALVFLIILVGAFVNKILR